MWDDVVGHDSVPRHPVIVSIPGTPRLLQDIQKVNRLPVVPLPSRESGQKCESHREVCVPSWETLLAPEELSPSRDKGFGQDHGSNCQGAEFGPPIVERFRATTARVHEKALVVVGSFAEAVEPRGEMVQ